MIIDWTSTEATGISGIRIEMPNEARILIFTDNDLIHITDDHFEINLVAGLLDQIYVVPSPQSPLRYDDAPPDAMTFAESVNSTGSPTAGICTYDAITYAYKPYIICMYSYRIQHFYEHIFLCVISSE